MDLLKILPISKHTTFLHRFPEICNATQFDKQRATWVIFAEHLQITDFEYLDHYTNGYNPILSMWKVGGYEVALMGGHFTLQHQQILQQLKLDFANLQNVADLSTPGLMLFDMDSTAIQIECIDEIAKLAGVGDAVSAITEQAMQGKLDFEQSLRQRVAQLKGADESILKQVREQLPFTPEFKELIATLKTFGWKTAIASGGFTYFSDFVQQQVGLDFARSNQLEIIDGKLTGQVLGDVVSAQTKADILVELAERYQLEIANTVAVGDGANDLVMMNAAGLGVAYHAKPIVQQQAQTALRVSELGGVLCILSARLVQQRKISWS